MIKLFGKLLSPFFNESLTLVDNNDIIYDDSSNESITLVDDNDIIYDDSSNESITLVDNNDIIFNDSKIAETFNDFFTNAVKNLNIIIDPALTSNTDLIEDPIEKAIEKYKNHPSIVKIKEVNGDTIKFSFKNSPVKEMGMEISK